MSEAKSAHDLMFEYLSNEENDTTPDGFITYCVKTLGISPLDVADFVQNLNENTWEPDKNLNLRRKLQ